MTLECEHRLRALTHAHATDAAKAQQRAALQQVVTSIADDIRKCGSDLTYYMDRKAICEHQVIGSQCIGLLNDTINSSTHNQRSSSTRKTTKDDLQTTSKLLF